VGTMRLGSFIVDNIEADNHTSGVALLGLPETRTLAFLQRQRRVGGIHLDNRTSRWRHSRTPSTLRCVSSLFFAMPTNFKKNIYIVIKT
jgi:hypothetical protein